MTASEKDVARVNLGILLIFLSTPPLAIAQCPGLNEVV